MSARRTLFAASIALLALAGPEYPGAAALAAEPAVPAMGTETAVPEPAAPAPAATAGDEAIGFFPVEQIHPGLEGIGRTVFEGDAVEEFGVEFLGVLKSAIGPQQDMVLARLHGEKVEFTGVISGMSGSPVYVDGRLVGAVSYRLGQFGKEAIVGITPIADMLKLVPEPAGERVARDDRRAPDLLGSFLRGDLQAGEMVAEGAEGPVVTTAVGGLQRIGTPLLCSGCDPDVLAYYAPIFRAHGLEPAAGGGMAQVDTPLPLLPGTGIGGSLVTGDLSIAGVGTLTHVEGNRIFAFGHPFLGTGSIEIPMTQAQVLLTYASSAASFRVANSTAPIGTLVEDRLTAIVGEVGRTPPMVPYTVRVRAPSGNREFHYDLVDERSWTPVMVALATGSSLTRTTEYAASATLALSYRIDIDGYPEIALEDLYSGTNQNQPVHLALANETGGLFSVLANNPFEDVRIRSVEADVEVLKESQIALITSLRASDTIVRPGEPFEVTATLRPFRGEDRKVTFEVALPENTPGGQVDIEVGGGSAFDGLDRKVRERQIAQSGSVKDLIRLIGRQRKNRTLYLRVMRASPSAIVRSEVLPDLPLSVFTVFNNPRLSADTTLTLGTPVVDLSEDLDVVAVGGRRITLKVQ